MADLDTQIQEARAALDAHVAEIVQWHFSPETGCPFWLDWAKQTGCNPTKQVQGFDDLCHLPDGLFSGRCHHGVSCV